MLQDVSRIRSNSPVKKILKNITQIICLGKSDLKLCFMPRMEVTNLVSQIWELCTTACMHAAKKFVPWTTSRSAEIFEG